MQISDFCTCAYEFADIWGADHKKGTSLLNCGARELAEIASGILRKVHLENNIKWKGFDDMPFMKFLDDP